VHPDVQSLIIVLSLAAAVLNLFGATLKVTDESGILKKRF
jgi:hypothetical protein